MEWLQRPSHSIQYLSDEDCNEIKKLESSLKVPDPFLNEII
jgi:hypothetical protein